MRVPCPISPFIVDFLSESKTWSFSSVFSVNLQVVNRVFWFDLKKNKREINNKILCWCKNESGVQVFFISLNGLLI